MASDTDKKHQRRDDLLNSIRQRELEPDESSSTAGAAKGGITSEESGSVSAVSQPTGDLTDEQILRLSEETAINYVTDERRPDNATIIDFARAIERAAIAAHLARQAQAEPVGHKDVEWLVECAEMARQNPDLASEIRAKCKAVAPAGAQPTKPTDLSHRLRETADQQPGWKSLLTAAADEIERYYGGMLAWKRTAEKKDREWAEERAGAQNAEAIRNQAGAAVQIKADRWDFMMTIADNEGGPEEKAMEAFNGMFDADRPKSVQLSEMVDAARAALQTGTANTQEGGDK